jgi:hypothetical protein
MKLDRKKTYYKVTNKEEIHHGLQYHDGIVKDILPFNADKNQSCAEGGIYFTDIHNIGAFFSYGCWVRPVTIPQKAKVIVDPAGDKLRASMVKMGKRIEKIIFLAKLPKKYKGSLYLGGCDLKGITLPTSVGGSLDLGGCDLKGITLPTSVGGSLYLGGCDLKGITLPTSVGGYLYLSGCDLKGITLPTSVGGYLYLSGCDLKGITLPTSVGGSLDLRGCDIPKKLDLSNYGVIS